MEFLNIALFVEEMDDLLISVPDFDEIGRQLTALSLSRAEVALEIASVASHRLAQLGELFERFENVLQLCSADFLIVRQILETHIFGPKRNQYFVQLDI